MPPASASSRTITDITPDTALIHVTTTRRHAVKSSAYCPRRCPDTRRLVTRRGAVGDAGYRARVRSAMIPPTPEQIAQSVRLGRRLREVRAPMPNAAIGCPVGYSESPTADDVASITSGPPACATCTLRALDCSATGIVIVSTPWS
jgi:hypothetical protein